jgi:hypothetical protein
VAGHRIDECCAARPSKIYRVPGRPEDGRGIRPTHDGVEIAAEDVVRSAGGSDLDRNRARAGIDKRCTAAAGNRIADRTDDTLIAAAQADRITAVNRVIAREQLQGAAPNTVVLLTPAPAANALP